MNKLIAYIISVPLIASCSPQEDNEVSATDRSVFEKKMIGLKSGDGFEVMDGERALFYPAAFEGSSLRILSYAYLGRVKVANKAEKDLAFQRIGHQVWGAYDVDFITVFNGPASDKFQPNYIVLMAGDAGVVNLIFTDTVEDSQYDILMTVAGYEVNTP